MRRGTHVARDIPLAKNRSATAIRARDATGETYGVTTIHCVDDAEIEIPCVGAICFDDEQRILLILRGQPPAEGLWSLPGGRIEAGETADAAVVREVREETGLVVRIDREVGTVRRAAPSGGTYVIRDFLVTASAGELRAGDDARDARWVPVVDLDGWETSPGLVDALDSWGLRNGDLGRRF